MECKLHDAYQLVQVWYGQGRKNCSPVWPYAKQVALVLSKIVGIMGSTVTRYTCYCKACYCFRTKIKTEASNHFHKYEIPITTTTNKPNNDVKTTKEKRLIKL